MKTIYLASFLQKNNFGPGEVISITNGKKPYNVDVKHIFKPLAPPVSLMEEYRSISDKEEAGKFFVSKYNNLLQEFTKEVLAEAEKEKISPQDVLPFEDGDTLCSWERDDHTNYRSVLKPYLESLGFKVIAN